MTTSVGLLAVMFAWPPAVSAAEDPGVVPPEAVTWFDTVGVASALENAEMTGDLPTGLRASQEMTLGTPRQVHLWTEAFYAGDPSGPPIEAIEEWMAPVLLGGEPFSIQSAWRNPEIDEVEVGFYASDSAGLAQSLIDQPAEATLVVEGGTHTFYYILDGLVTQVSGLAGEPPVTVTLEEAARQAAEWAATLPVFTSDDPAEFPVGFKPLRLQETEPGVPSEVTQEAAGSLRGGHGPDTRVLLFGLGTALIAVGAGVLSVRRRLASAASVI